MGNEVKLFENVTLGTTVRTIQDAQGEIWFVAKDVAEALEYTWNGVARVAHVPEEWRGVTSVVSPSGTQEMITLSEQGLYFFLGRSDKPKALPYQKWIAGEVLPSIRKTGGYGQPREVLPQDYVSALRALADAEEAKQLAQATASAAIAERNHAIKTKAEIGSRREAAAMNTASILSKENDKLRIEIGDSKYYKQVKAIPWLLDEFDSRRAMYSMVGRKLSEISRRMGYDVKEVSDTQYGVVKAYHIDVINAFREMLDMDRNMLRKYRIY